MILNLLGAFVQHFLAQPLGNAGTLHAILAGIDCELLSSPRADAAIGILAKSKLELYACLRTRFPVPSAQALTLKILNICLAKYHFRRRHASLLSRPVGLVADPSNNCRLACPGCVHSNRSEELRLFNWPNGTLPEHRFTTLLRTYGPFAVGVYFCSYGEPLLNLNTPALVRSAKSFLLSTALSTSLSVRRFDADAYVRSGLDFMVLSIDGASQPVYERYRRNGDLELVFRNTRQLVDAKRRLGSHTPVLSWNFLAFEHNVHEIPLAARMARQLGVNLFRVVKPFDVSWDDPEIRVAEVKPKLRRLQWISSANLPGNWNPFPESVDAATIARAFESPWDSRQAAEEPSNPGHTCHWLYKNIVMDAGGRILPCCGAPRPDAHLVFTTIDESPVHPFNSEEHRQARSILSGAPAPSERAPYCVNCEWDKTTVNIGGSEIRHYFRAADAGLFPRATLGLLSEW